MEEFRPQGWDKRKTQCNDDLESGASLLLVALRETGFHINVGQVVEIEGTKVAATKNQTLVLIPDDIA